MNILGFDTTNKKGRPEHKEHRCDICQKTCKTAAALASHKQDAKKGKVKCIVPQTSSNDGPIAPQQTLNLIATGLGPRSMFNQPLPQVFKQERQEYPQRHLESSTSADTIELLEKRLRSTTEWEMVYDLCHSEDFNSLPLTINEKFALSFLVQTASMEEHHPSFLSAFVKVVSALTIRKIPAHLLEAFKPFLQKFRPTEDDKVADLIVLFEFTKALGCCWEWLSFAQEKAVIIMSDPISCTLQESGPLTEAFASQYKLYSSSFFAAYDNMMRLPGLQRIMFNYIDEFFQFVLDGKERRVTYELVINFKSFKQANKEFDICLLANKLRACTTQIIPEDDILQLIRLCLKHNEAIIMEQIRFREAGENMPAFVSRLEDILQEKAVRVKAEEELKQQEKQRLLGNKTKEEEQKRIAAEQEQQILQQLEEQKQTAEQEKRLYQEQLITSISHQFDLFVDKNQFQKETLAQVLSFVSDLQKIAANINKHLKAEQLVTLGLLLLSQKHATLIQLATGFGKSMLLGILAEHLNKTTGKKVIVVVPTEFLHLYQESHYCPTASKIPEDINDSAVAHIFYCTHKQFILLDPAMLISAIVLVDEFHELFFNYPLSIADGKLVSVVAQLNLTERIIGVSATFRGDAGIKKIKNILADSLFLISPECFQEKRFELEVFGGLDTRAIKQKAILLAKEKFQQMPVVVFCADIIICKKWKKKFPGADIFAVNETSDDVDNAGNLVALLQNFSQLSKGIVLTTSADCMGADFVFAVPQAFVIHTSLPSTWLQLQQDFGRGVRGNQLPIIGAIFIEGPQNNLEQIKQKLMFADRFDKLFTTDYVTAHSFLVVCSISNATKPVITFETAVSMLNEGKSATEIYKVLNTVKRFREFLPKEAPKAEFKVPMIQLGKRNAPEKIRTNTLENYLAPRSTSSSFMSKAIKEADEVIQLQQQTMNDFPQAQQENYEHSTFENGVNVTTHQKQVSEQVVFKHDALQAIAVTKAKEVLAGIKINEECKSEDSEEPIKRCVKNQESAVVQVGQSKTSSVILFGEKQNHEQKPDPSESLSQFSSDGNLASESLETGINKRELKQWEKGSVANSSRTNQSKRSIGSKHGIHKKKQCPHCQYEGQTCDLKKHIQRKHKNL